MFKLALRTVVGGKLPRRHQFPVHVVSHIHIASPSEKFFPRCLQHLPKTHADNVHHIMDACCPAARSKGGKGFTSMTTRVDRQLAYIS